MSKTQILIVEDDKDILKINFIHLTKEGYDVITAETLEEAYEAVMQNNPGLIVLDIKLPDGSGLTFCEKIRDITSVPIIFLTCFDSEQDKVKGLMVGGDDYLTKPYNLSELSARIYALLRRIQINDTKILEYPPVKIDTTAQIAYLNGEDTLLTPKEYKLLLILVKNMGRPINSSMLYKKLWGIEAEEGLKTIQVHISSIRKKLKMDADSAAQIKTVRNVGYCFEYEKIH